MELYYYLERADRELGSWEGLSLWVKNLSEEDLKKYAVSEKFDVRKTIAKYTEDFEALFILASDINKKIRKVVFDSWNGDYATVEKLALDSYYDLKNQSYTICNKL